MDMDTDTRATKEIILETIRATTKEIIKETIKDIKATKATKATRVTTTMATTITTNRDHLTSTLSLATILDLDPLARFTMAVAVALFDVEDSEAQTLINGPIDGMTPSEDIQEIKDQTSPSHLPAIAITR
ncbi:hypothetical protein CPC16_001480 [Podila verticillata]|nr:hypothetical protein CPC16_001480 [Podila verticillata]